MKIDFIKKNLLKRNQVIIYTIALLLVTAGYLNFTSLNETEETASLQTEQSSTNNYETENNIEQSNVEESKNEESKNEEKKNEDNTQIANIGDATLVNSDEVVSTNISNVDEYFTKSKLERDNMYSQILETYEKILDSSNSSEAQKQTATKEISKINETKNSIMICENLIGTKGFTKNVVFVNGNSINVIVGTNQLKQEQVAQIQNIISREMQAEIENIHIAMK